MTSSLKELLEEEDGDGHLTTSEGTSSSSGSWPELTATPTRKRRSRALDELRIIRPSANNSPKRPRPSCPERVVGEWRIVCDIGRGSFGIVSKAVAVASDEVVVAVKSIELREGNAERDSAHEIELSRTLQHPNIVTFLEVVHAPKRAFLIMEYIELDLSERILQASPLLQPELEQYAYDLLNGLNYLHSRGIVHRDVKPNNLLISPTHDRTPYPYKLKICDFGLSARTDRAQTNVSCLRFASPELLVGENYTTAIDVWAAGCVLAEGVVGGSLFRGSTEIQRAHSIYRICGRPAQSPAFSPLFAADDDEEHATSVQEELRKNARTAITGDFIELLSRMLTCEPRLRITALQALRHMEARGLAAAASLARNNNHEGAHSRSSTAPAAATHR